MTFSYPPNVIVVPAGLVAGWVDGWVDAAAVLYQTVIVVLLAGRRNGGTSESVTNSWALKPAMAEVRLDTSEESAGISCGSRICQFSPFLRNTTFGESGLVISICLMSAAA